jgi:hypothetical protein
MTAVEVEEQVILLSKVKSHVILPMVEGRWRASCKSLGTISLCGRGEPSHV